MEASRQRRNPSHSEIRPASQQALLHGRRRTLSNDPTASVDPAIQQARNDLPRDSNAFAEFRFFDDDGPGAGAAGLATHDIPFPDLAKTGSAVSSNRSNEEERDFKASPGTHILERYDSPYTPAPYPIPQYIDARRLRLEELIHPSGSPVLGRELLLNVKFLDTFAPDQKLEDGSDAKEDELSAFRDRNLAALRMPTISVAKLVAKPCQSDPENSGEPDLEVRERSADQNPKHTQPIHNDAQTFRIPRKSLPVAAACVSETPTTTLESTRDLLENLADQGCGTTSIEPVADRNEILGTVSSGGDTVPQSQFATLVSSISSSNTSLSQPRRKKASQNIRETANANVSQEMLKHFCGEEHLARLIRDYSLHPEQRTEDDGEKNILIFPERSVDATAILRIVRYMRRCCMRTTTITKPHFQLHAPPSLEANIETIRACNIFGLYADARRLQHFLTDKKIPGGKLTMEDVETIWEGYGGGLRDSAYTDALLTHLVYNVLGSDSVDREEFIVLLDQEEFAGLRELVGMELGIKKRAAEDREMFQMRLQLEREESTNQAIGKGKRHSKMDKIRAIRGPMVQGRLLRVLSYDALLEPDLTAETRYKARPGLGRRSVSTPDLVNKANEAKESEGLKPAGQMFQDALKEIKEWGAADIERAGATPLPATQTGGRPPAPTPSGRRYRIDRPEQWRGQHFENTHPPVPQKEHLPHPNLRPQNASHLYARSVSSGVLDGNAGRRQPWPSIVNVQRAPMLRSRTDPFWVSLGDPSRAAKKKTPSKLKQVWEEMRNFF
ncbi:hypothetical protein SLS60_005996 [Paraconiothyrium brasiliense]|uniref:Uncharacterized protein n=1 Tax=Paraconiothyrium brasiliense TaxID=300254 RepID=A0ABR3RDS2_9PLEO